MRVKRPVVFAVLLGFPSVFVQAGTDCVPAPPGLIHWYRGEGDANDFFNSASPSGPEPTKIPAPTLNH